MSVAAAEQLAYESRVRLRYAWIAFGAAVLIVAAQLIQLSGVHPGVGELTIYLIAAHQNTTVDLVSAILQALGLLAIAATLGWLQEIARARARDQKAFVRWIAVVGACLSAVMFVIYSFVIAHKANVFVSTGNQTYMQANELTKGGLLLGLQLLLELGSFLLAGGFIWIALNAMRVGLLPRVLGYTGVFAGAFVLFPVGAIVPLVQGFWLAAVALIIAGRWPQGTPPAWEQGVAVPWAPSRPPDSRQRREQRGRRGSAKEPVAVAVVEETAEESAARNRSNTPKRKRKSRN